MKKSRLAIVALLSALMITPSNSDACSRAVYFGKAGQTVTGRTMDWFVSDMDTNMWLYPRGLERTSNTKTPLKWKSKYGSVVTTIYEGAAADGMNEKGLVANMLYLAEAKYPEAKADDKRPTLPISAWAQYLLDNYATTAEAVESLRKEEFRMVPILAPTGEPGTVHLAISDESGDSAIFEYIDGKLVIHHGRQYQVMTNSPIFSEQIPLAAYWKSIGGRNDVAWYQSTQPIALHALRTTSTKPHKRTMLEKRWQRSLALCETSACLSASRYQGNPISQTRFGSP